MSRVLGNDVKVLLTKGTGWTGNVSPRSRSLGTRNICANLSSVDRNAIACLRQTARPARSSGSQQSTINWSPTPNYVAKRYDSNIARHNASQAVSATAGEPLDDKAPEPPFTIVFTDIVSSTALWEKDTAAMTEAMTIHDDMMREYAGKYAGYEVKQNGDGFMFVFQSAPSALNFCLDIQVQLQSQKWPAGLLKLDGAEPVVVDADPDNGNDQTGQVVLWKGLRLRMSAHYGEPVCKWNDVIGRMDYLGPAVNRAARFVGVCEGGQIVASEDFLLELRRARRDVVGSGGPLFDEISNGASLEEDLDVRDIQPEGPLENMKDTRFELRILGDRQFKGVPGTQTLYFIMPKSLRKRIDYLPKQEFVQPSKGNLIEG